MFLISPSSTIFHVKSFFSIFFRFIFTRCLLTCLSRVLVIPFCIDLYLYLQFSDKFKSSYFLQTWIFTATFPGRKIFVLNFLLIPFFTIFILVVLCNMFFIIVKEGITLSEMHILKSCVVFTIRLVLISHIFIIITYIAQLLLIIGQFWTSEKCRGKIIQILFMVYLIIVHTNTI